MINTDWKKEYNQNKKLYDLEIGQEIAINSNLKGIIIEKHNGHGLFYIIQLPQKDYTSSSARKIRLDVEELEEYRKYYTNEIL